MAVGHRGVIIMGKYLTPRQCGKCIVVYKNKYKGQRGKTRANERRQFKGQHGVRAMSTRANKGELRGMRANQRVNKG